MARRQARIERFARRACVLPVLMEAFQDVPEPNTLRHLQAQSSVANRQILQSVRKRRLLRLAINPIVRFYRLNQNGRDQSVYRYVIRVEPGKSGRSRKPQASIWALDSGRQSACWIRSAWHSVQGIERIDLNRVLEIRFKLLEFSMAHSE